MQTYGSPRAPRRAESPEQRRRAALYAFTKWTDAQLVAVIPFASIPAPQGDARRMNELVFLELSRRGLVG